MKNIIVIIVASVLCTLSVQANPAHKAKDKIANPHHGIKNKVEHKKNKAQNPQKKKIDITVKENRKSNDKSTNWTDKRKPRDFAKDKKNATRGTKKKHEIAHKDFHKWSNKTKDSIESRMKKNDPKYQSADPFYNERHQ